MAIVKQASPQSLQQAANIIKNGGLVVLPTNTNYSIICNPFDIEAVQALFQAKKRTKFGPLTLVFSSFAEISKYTLPTPGFSIEIAQKLWPGEVSFILYKQDIIPNVVTCGANTIAVACHDHPVLQELLKVLGQPICFSSANLSGQGDIWVSLEKAIADLSEAVDLIIDGGLTKAALHPSKHKSNTIVDFTFQPPYLVRKGLLETTLLLKSIPNLVTVTARYQVALKARRLNQ